MKKKAAVAPVVKPEKGPAPEKIYETEIEYMCPVRGLIKQKVKVKKYRGCDPQLVDDIRLPSKSLTDQLDLKYSGLMLDDNTIDEDKENNT